MILKKTLAQKDQHLLTTNAKLCGKKRKIVSINSHVLKHLREKKTTSAINKTN